MENKGNKMEKRYGFYTALSMVIGVVIGSGIFFKAVKVLKLCNGNMVNAIFVVLIVGSICIICSCLFARMGRKYASCNGLVDYAEATLGPKYAYVVGWFLATFYYPIIAATLSYISASYFCMLLGLEMHGQAATGLGALFMIIIIVINMLSPKIAGKFQISTTIIKLIPLISMTLVGLFIGIRNGNIVSVLQVSDAIGTSSNDFFAAVCAFAFSCEGWISCTSINQELKNPKRDLPLALIVGGIFCTVLYGAYILSMSATLTPAQIIAAGDNLPKIAFTNVFGSFAGNIVLVFIIISCLGTANGMTMGSLRCFYALAVRGEGIAPNIISKVDEDTGMPLKSCILGMLCIGFWYFQSTTLFFQGPLAFNGLNSPDWLLAWEADEICIVIMYLLYIPIFIYIIFKEKDFGFVYRYILSILSIICSLFMSYCAYHAYGLKQTIYFTTFFIILTAIGLLVRKPKHN